MIPLPKSFQLISGTGNTALFECEGLYPGYGITLGNALRRVLLSSLPGAAIISTKIKGASHEFSTMPGILEDMLELSLNLKNVRLILHGEEPQMIALKVKGKKDVTAGDISCPSQVEIINPEAHIATITDRDGTLEMEMEVAPGVGYEAADQRKGDKSAIGVIALDAFYSPVKKANFIIEDMRIGDRTDYNRLRLEIETDGATSPLRALEGALGIIIGQYTFFAQNLEEAIQAEASSKKSKSKRAKEQKEDADGEDIAKQKVEELNISTRTANVLQEGGIKTVAGLVRKGEADLLALEGMGDKGVDEVKKALKKEGLALKEKE